MKKELQEKLFEKYPKIFSKIISQARKEKPISYHVFGICTDDGWFKLIDTLCQTLQNITDNRKEPQIIVAQVKQKFGSLRFYTENKNSPIQYATINFAESISKCICEECGTMDDVSLSDGPWVKSLCKRCLSECDHGEKEEN